MGMFERRVQLYGYLTGQPGYLVPEGGPATTPEEAAEIYNRGMHVPAVLLSKLNNKLVNDHGSPYKLYEIDDEDKPQYLARQKKVRAGFAKYVFCNLRVSEQVDKKFKNEYDGPESGNHVETRYLKSIYDTTFYPDPPQPPAEDPDAEARKAQMEENYKYRVAFADPQGHPEDFNAAHMKMLQKLESLNPAELMKPMTDDELADNFDRIFAAHAIIMNYWNIEAAYKDAGVPMAPEVAALVNKYNYVIPQLDYYIHKLDFMESNYYPLLDSTDNELLHLLSVDNRSALSAAIDNYLMNEPVPEIQLTDHVAKVATDAGLLSSNITALQGQHPNCRTKNAVFSVMEHMLGVQRRNIAVICKDGKKLQMSADFNPYDEEKFEMELDEVGFGSNDMKEMIFFDASDPDNTAKQFRVTPELKFTPNLLQAAVEEPTIYNPITRIFVYVYNYIMAKMWGGEYSEKVFQMKHGDDIHDQMKTILENANTLSEERKAALLQGGQPQVGGNVPNAEVNDAPQHERPQPMNVNAKNKQLAVTMLDDISANDVSFYKWGAELLKQFIEDDTIRSPEKDLLVKAIAAQQFRIDEAKKNAPEQPQQENEVPAQPEGEQPVTGPKSFVRDICYKAYQQTSGIINDDAKKMSELGTWLKSGSLAKTELGKEYARQLQQQAGNNAQQVGM